jgi:hypothetical protein
LERKFRRILVGVLALLIAAFIALKLRYRGTAPVKLSATQCDAGLWKHVYQPERLKVVEPCTAVEGRVVTVHQAVDGDLHVGLDPDEKSVLNLMNVTHGHRQLIVEAVCDHSPGKTEARAACADFTSTVRSPTVGDHVRALGAYVTDTDNGWNEIHPVTRIEVLAR